MDYEKKYKEAIERLKQWDREHPNGYSIQERDEFIFPELKINDESIRKSLIKIFEEKRQYDHIKGILIKDILTWLEKQGEQKPILDVEIPFGAKDSELEEVSYNILDGYHAEIEDNKVVIKKGEQKPADLKTKAGNWYICDEEVINENMVAVFHPNEIYYCPKDGYLDDGGALFEVGYLNVFRLATEKEIPQSKQKWSEEDENWLINAINVCELYDHNETAEWLKSLKDRVWPQNFTVTDEELIQAKKDAYNDALNKIEYHSGEPTFDDGWSAAIWYLKKRNAQPQSTWKPSEEQLKLLQDICGYNTIITKKEMGVLESLLEQLKKLTE